MATNKYSFPSSARTSAISMWQYPIGYRLNCFFLGLSPPTSGSQLMLWRCKHRCKADLVRCRSIACKA